MASTTTAEIRVDGERIAEVEEFDYSSDILAVGEEAHITVPDPKAALIGKLRAGQLVEFLMRDPAVNGGSPTLKHRGRITRRSARVDRSGTKIKLVSADLGWHLMKCCAPLWFNLKRVALRSMVDPAFSAPGSRRPIPSLVNEQAYHFGFKGVRGNNVLNRRSKLGLAALKTLDQGGIEQIFAIQAEPGDLLYDLISNQARRFNLLLNVSVDGYIQLWNPDYSQAPSYSLYSVPAYSQNNILSAEEAVSADTMFTDVDCVGQQVAWEDNKEIDPRTPNAGKKRGRFSRPSLLPFTHRLTFADPEMFNSGLAQKAAEWRWKRSWFDSYQLVVSVKDHHQSGLWWESDTMCNVNISQLGVYRNLYIQSVQCRVSLNEGATTQIVLREPNLLSAAFDEIPDPPTPRAK